MTLYYGSKYEITKFEPTYKNSINANVVIAATTKVLALLYCLTDNEFEFDIFTNKNKIILAENTRNAFKVLHTPAYLYYLDSKGFKPHPLKHMRGFEMVSYNEVPIVKRELIKCVFKELKKDKNVRLVTLEEKVNALRKAFK